MEVVNKKIKVVLILILLIIEGMSIFLMWQSSSNKEIILDDVELKDIKNNSNVAIMIEQDDGSYLESESSTWPKGMKLNEEKSKCLDTHGLIVENVITYDIASSIINVEISNTINCYIFFDIVFGDVVIDVLVNGEDKELPTSGIYLKNVECNNGYDGFWDIKYNRLSFDNIKMGQECTINYNEDLNSYPTLKSEVEKIIAVSNNGYRYSGKNPNNYVWFNNELWRIIGSIPTKISSSGTTENRIKIIRAESIGALAFDGDSDASDYWGSNTLYKLLNPVDGDNNSGIYFNSLNGIDGPYCGKYSKCDYRAIGLGGINSYYGKMVDYVYWNTGGNYNSRTAAETFSEEKSIQTVQGYVGLMSASDYGYAALSVWYDSDIGSYYYLLKDKENGISNLWLFYSSEWILTKYAATAGNTRLISTFGSLSYSSHASVINIRPVVYLKKDVYVINSNEENVGTQTNPYIIAM